MSTVHVRPGADMTSGLSAKSPPSGSSTYVFSTPPCLLLPLGDSPPRPASPSNGAATSAEETSGRHLSALLAQPQVHKLLRRYQLTRHQLDTRGYRRSAAARRSANASLISEPIAPSLSSDALEASWNFSSDFEDASWVSDSRCFRQGERRGSTGRLHSLLGRIPSFEEFQRSRRNSGASSLANSCTSIDLEGVLTPQAAPNILPQRGCLSLTSSYTSTLFEELEPPLARSCSDVTSNATPERRGLQDPPCGSVAKRRAVILELIETERRYGEDLELMLSEFQEPLVGADSVLGGASVTELFANLPELLKAHRRLLGRLETAVAAAEKDGDPWLTSVNIGHVFLKCSAVLLKAFERYCANHGRALATLQTLEKDSPILRLFLGAAREDNPCLRRQDLRSFLILPVQRVARYPLLLQRLQELSREANPALSEALSQLGAMLQRINQQCPSPRGEPGTPDQAAFFGAGLKILCATAATAHLVSFGPLRIATSSAPGASLRFQGCLALLVTVESPGQDGDAMAEPNLDDDSEAAIGRLRFPRHQTARQHHLLLFHANRPASAPSLAREPFCLSECVLSRVVHHPTAFQLQVMRRDSVMLSGARLTDSDRWFGQIKQLVLSSGAWRLRRPAMPHVMLTQRRGSLLSTAL